MFFCSYKISNLTVPVTSFLLFFFQFSFLSAQENKKDSLEAPFIYVDQSVQIFSNDELFTKQLLHSGKTVKNEITSTNKILDNKIVNESDKVEIGKVVGSVSPVFENQEITKEGAKIADEKIEEFKEAKKKFLKQEFTPFQSSDKFQASKKISKSYINPHFYVYDLEHCFNEKNLSAKEGLKYIHSQKFRNYNSKSFGFCFSSVSSVRPPPKSYQI